jgi:hypothetical protein
MMRKILVPLGFALGLLAAVALGGRMAHLRALGFAGSQGWSAGIADEAGLVAGTAVVPGGVVDWVLSGVDLSGPHWRVTLTGPDWQTQGRARLATGGLSLAGLSGLLDTVVLGGDWAGQVALSGGAMVLALPSGSVTEAQLVGQTRNLSFGGAPFDGAVTLSLQDGVWSVVAD